MSRQIPGVPLILQTMIEQLATNNVISNWNIYENRTGQVCLNIRFDVEGGRPGNVGDSQLDNDLLNTQYKKVSPKQQARNMHRAREHRNTMMTRSQSKAAPDNEIEHARSIESDNDSLSSISIDAVISKSQQCSPQILTPTSNISSQCQPSSPQFVTSSLTAGTCSPVVNIVSVSDSAVQVSPVVISYSDTASQIKIDSNDQYVQAVVAPKKVTSRKCQTTPTQHKNKFSQICQRSENICVQAGSGLFSTADLQMQVGPSLCQLVDSSNQVTLDLDVARDTASDVTTDLAELVSKHSQTQFLCPGNEDDPSGDLFWLNKPCLNSSCRYAGRRSRLLRGPLYICHSCDIVMCRQCKDETIHDEVCEDQLQFLEVVSF